MRYARSAFDASLSSQTQEQEYVPRRPMLTILLVGHSFMLVLVLSLMLGMLTSMEGLKADPPRLSWHFAVVLLGGTTLGSLLQLAVLYMLKDPGFWPQNAKQWLQRVAPAFALVAVGAMSIFTPARNEVVIFAGVTMLAGLAIGMIPPVLCFADGLKYMVARAKETIQLRSLDKAELPRDARLYFDEHTDQFLKMGFDLLGDYQTKRYTPTYARFFLNRERDTFGEITHARIGFIPVRVVCFFSITVDGHYLESSNTRWGKARRTRYFETQILPQASHQDVYDRHRERLAELTDQPARSLTIDDLQTVIHFGNKQIHELMIADGYSRMNPYADFDESVLIQPRPTGNRRGDDVFESPAEELSASL